MRRVRGLVFVIPGVTWEILNSLNTLLYINIEDVPLEVAKGLPWRELNEKLEQTLKNGISESRIKLEFKLDDERITAVINVGERSCECGRPIFTYHQSVIRFLHNREELEETVQNVIMPIISAPKIKISGALKIEDFPRSCTIWIRRRGGKRPPQTFSQ